MLHITGAALEDKAGKETFIEVQKVVDKVNETFVKAEQPNSEINKEDGEDDKEDGEDYQKCQRFIVSIMRLVQKNI